MKCMECGADMIRVGRQIQPGNPSIWVEGFVCPTRRCPGYGSLDFENRKCVWPAMTLDGGVPFHAMIQGAKKFRDGQKG